MHLPEGGGTLILEVRFDETIGDVIKYIEEERPELKAVGGRGGDGRYELRSRFPNRSFQAMDKSVEDEGLTPNATLFFQRKKNG